MRQADEERKLRKALAGSTTTQTFFSRAEAEIILQSQGRHALASKPTVNGTEASVRYPRQPENSPFAADLTGPEPSLGYAIDAQECVGEFHEIQESLIAASVAIPSSDAVPAREDVDATPPRSAAPVGDFVSSSTGVTSTRLTRGRKL
jgi:hypothetical protein